MYLLTEVIKLDEVRQVLLIPIGFCTFFLCLLIVLIWLELKGKLTPPALKSIRSKFDKSHPGLNRKLTIGLAAFLGIAFIIIFHSYTLDFIDNEYVRPDVMTATEGGTRRASHAL